MEESFSNKVPRLPKVTIMIPTYNQEQYIGDAIKSALAQDYENLEVIVSDDCSSDGTAEVARSFETDKRLKYFKNPQNLGRVGNYHKSLYDYASGDWVVNLDGDDYYTDSTFISYAMDLILNNPSAIFFMASFNAKQNAQKILPYENTSSDAILLEGKSYFLRFSEIDWFNHYSLLYNRSRAKEIGFYTFDCLASDFHSGIRLALHGNVILSERTVGHWRKHEKNASITEIKNTRELNVQAIKDVAIQAQEFVSFREAAEWEKKAIQSIDYTYIMSVANTSSSWKDMPFLFSHFIFNKTFVITFTKMWLRCLGISKLIKPLKA